MLLHLPSPPLTPDPLAADFDETADHEEVDDETTGNLQREIEKAEKENHPQGRPGSFLNRMISHGNKKTEDQIAEEQKRVASGTLEGQQKQGLSSATNQKDQVIR